MHITPGKFLSVLLLMGATLAGGTTIDPGGTLTIVTLLHDAPCDQILQANAITPRFIYRHALNGFAAAINPSLAEHLRADARVESVEDDNARFAPCAQTISSGVIRMGTTNFPVARINGQDERLDVDVAVFDVGVQLDHPDLNIYLPGSVSFADSSTNGSGWTSHGTHVAGIIGALDNDIGVVGVAPGVRLWSVQVIGPTQAGLANLLAGLDYISEHADQIAVVNASIGGLARSSSTYSSMRTAILNVVSQGVVFVAAAGNDAVDILGADLIQGSASNNVPAAIPEVMAVSAIDSTVLKSTGDPNDRYDTFWGPSNYSQVQKSPKLVNSPGAGIDVAAPGVSIYSCALNSGYTSMTGTSMATAHVTGLVALYIAANGRAHNLAEVLQIRQAIINASQPQSAWANTGASNDPDNNPEPLAVVSNSWIPVPTIQSLNRTSSATMLNFGIVPGFCYTVQSTDVLGDGQNWTDLQTANGSGGFRSITITNPTSNASQMYRLRRTIIP